MKKFYAHFETESDNCTERIVASDHEEAYGWLANHYRTQRDETITSEVEIESRSDETEIFPKP